MTGEYGVQRGFETRDEGALFAPETERAIAKRPVRVSSAGNRRSRRTASCRRTYRQQVVTTVLVHQWSGCRTRFCGKSPSLSSSLGIYIFFLGLSDSGLAVSPHLGQV